MKKRKIIYLFPLAALLISGCSFADVKHSIGESWVGEHLLHPIYDPIRDLVTGNKEEETENKPQHHEEEHHEEEHHDEIVAVSIKSLSGVPEEIELGEELKASSLTAVVVYSDNTEKTEAVTKVELDTSKAGEVTGKAYVNSLVKEFTIEVFDSSLVDVTASYTVKHMKQDLTGSGYTEADSETLEGTVGRKTAGVAKTYEGFTAVAFEQVRIAEDGSTVLEIKYDRNLFTVTLDSNGGTEISPLSVRYETKLIDLDIPTTSRKGYSFVEWVHSDGTEITDEEIVTSALTLKATWDEVISSYQVKHLQQNVTGSEYTLVETENLEGQAYSLTSGVAKTYEGFTAKAFEQVEIAEDGSTVLEIKYDRNLLKVNFDSNGGETKESLNVRYGTKVADIEASSIKRTGYNFVKWVYEDGSEIEADDTLTSEITLKAKWSAMVSNVSVSGLGVEQNLTTTYDLGLSDDLEKPEMHSIAKVNGNQTDLDSYDWTKVTTETEVVYELDQTNGAYDFEEKVVTLGDWGNLLYKDTEGVYTIEARVEGNNQGQLNGGFQVVDKNGMILNLVSCMNTNGVAWVTAILGDGSNKQVNLFTPENGLGQEATLPSIPVEYGSEGQFVEGNYVGIKMSLTYDEDNSKLVYSLTNEQTKVTTKVIEWTIDDLKTNLELTEFDLSNGVVGFFHRNQDCTMYAGNIRFNNDSVICRHEGGHYVTNGYTCTTPGNKEFYECEKCGEIFMEEPGFGSFQEKDIKDYEGLDEGHPAYIAPHHEHGVGGTTIDADGMFNFECSVCHEHVKTDSYTCSGDLEEIKLDESIYESVRWLTFDVSNPATPYADAWKDGYGNAWSVGVMQALSWQGYNDPGYPFAICRHPSGYLAEFTELYAFTDGINDFNRGYKWLTDMQATTDSSSFSTGKINMGLAFGDGKPAVGLVQNMNGEYATTGDFNQCWGGGNYPCKNIIGIRTHSDVTLSNVVVSETELEHVHKVQANPYVANEGGLVGNECQLCGTELDYTFGANGDDYVDITNWWDRNYVKYISFHVDKPEQLPEYNCQGVGIVDDIEGWAEKSQFRLGISYYKDGRTWYLTYGNFQTFTSFEEAGICGSEPDAFPEDGIDLAYTLAQDESGKYDMTMYYKGGQVTEWTKWRSVNNDLESGYFDSYIERIYSKMEMTISNVYCSATYQQTARESVKTNEFKFLKETTGSYSYSMDVATNTNGDSDSGLIIKDANGQEIKISVRLQGRHLLCLTAITSDESGDHKLDYFTPYFQGMTGLTPSIGDFNSDKGDVYQRYVVRLEYNADNKEFSMYLSSTYGGDVNIKTWTISQLETDLNLSGLDFSSGSVGICARDCGSSYTATARNIILN